MTTQQKQSIVRMRKAGISYKDISTKLGLSVNTVKSFGRRCDAQFVDTSDHCKQCGNPVIQLPHRKHKSFCSDKCRYTWWYANHDLSKSAIPTICPGCGLAFMARRNQKHCSHGCYISVRFGGERHEQAAN